MQPAADAMAAALAETAMQMPSVPLIANVTAGPVSDPDTIRGLLVEQVTATVRWRESVMAMKALNVSRVFELGAGKVLAGLVKRIDKEIDSLSVGQPADIEGALKLL
jgi:[acyl-carrier-protein] S-malonyltransferase